MDEIEVKNARIESTMLGFEDHGVFTYFVYLDYGGSGQGFGGYGLGGEFGCEAITRLLRVVGVEKWEDLKGKSVRARADWGKVHALGHYLEDNWIDLSKLADKFHSEEASA